ncbi:MAG: ribonuclease III [Cardiobacteriaceae bacterium]|nr:ribonuclease III [Cardiobacteriaceae bacterium]
MRIKKDWASLEKRLGYQFHNKALLEQALTHSSFGATNNERLEFLGDAVLETVMSLYLYQTRAQAVEDELTRLRILMVRGETLARVAKRFGLSEFLRLGLGERKSGGQRRESILEDALEALIGAVYVDCGDFARCQQLLLSWFEPELEALPQSALALKDAKTRLQEYLQARGLPLPEYEVVAMSGPDHAKITEILAKSGHFSVQTKASSRKKAEQAAAEQLWDYYHQEYKDKI